MCFFMYLKEMESLKLEMNREKQPPTHLLKVQKRRCIVGAIKAMRFLEFLLLECQDQQDQRESYDSANLAHGHISPDAN